MRRHVWVLVGALGLVVAAAALTALYAYGPPAPAGVASRPRRRRRWQLLGAAGVGVLGIALVGGAYAYDAARAEVIAPGVRVGSVPVGGLSAAAARRKLTRAYRRLHRPVVVRSGRRRFVLTAWEAGVAVDVDDAVSRALARSRDGFFLSRSLRDLTGWDVDARIAPRVVYSSGLADRFVDGVVETVERRPRAARVVASGGGLVLRGARHGFEVDRRRLRRRIGEALTEVAAPRSLRVPGRRVRARVTLAALRRRYPAYITVDRAHFQLRVYEHLKLARTYPIAVGQIGLETPAGLYSIQNKAVNPSWSVPNSAWAGSLAGAVIPPGPSNPLKARWMGIYAGAGIHGTDDTWSLGSAASHGCIRMAVPDVIDLYDRVEVGTPVYIG